MAIEIERKFLITSDTYKSLASHSKSIIQGFLNKDPKRTVRVRLKEDKAFITVKGLSSKDGLSRFEWEKEITVQEAKELLKLCDDNLIEKRRYVVHHDNHIIEVDEFQGRLAGLRIAEVELKTTADIFNKPDWLGEEVTGDVRYYNSNL
jgi:CYTH domain-containing protein